MNIVIFGPPGSGKGTQSEFIIEKFKLTHISTGAVLRDHIKNETPLGKQAKGFIDKGMLVTDDLIIGMLSEWLDDNPSKAGYIFDGFPRTIAQAHALKGILKSRNTDIHVMLSLEVKKDELIDRLLKRGAKCGRADDNLKTIEKRIVVYNEQTAPVIDFYKEEGTHVGINGEGSIEEISKSIANALMKH